MQDFSRRGLLKATATAGVGAIVLPGAAAAEDQVASAAIDGAESVTGTPAKLTGRIVRPNDPGYPRASRGWDELFVHYPLVIVFAQETRDVVNALTWARQNDVALRVRSGRHSLEGWSNVDNGIVIDVSELKSVRIDTATRVATVGAGLSQLEAVHTREEGPRGNNRNGRHRGLVRCDPRRRLRVPHPLPRHGLRQLDSGGGRAAVGCQMRQGDQGGAGE